jgi:hypothetical protein
MTTTERQEMCCDLHSLMVRIVGYLELGQPEKALQSAKGAKALVDKLFEVALEDSLEEASTGSRPPVS